MSRRQRPVSGLPRALTLVYGVLVAYACLHPFSGWRDSGLPPLDFLTAPWPRYYTVADLVLNVLGFIPLAFVAVPALPTRLSGRWAVLLVTLLAALLSFSLEFTQNFLPTRVASNVDLGCNTLGAFIGAIAGVLVGHPLFDREGGLHRWRMGQILPGPAGDWGLGLLGLWLLAQLSPTSLSFASGDVRQLLDLPHALPFSPERFLSLEAAATTCAVLSAGLLAARLHTGRGIILAGCLLALGTAVKTLATTAFYSPPAPFGWLTPGTGLGLLFGVPTLLLALLLPAALRHALLAQSLLAATVLVNLMPDNPYLSLGEHLRGSGDFLNFHGLTQLTSSLWPFLALIYLSVIGRGPRGDDAPPGS